MRFLTPGSFFVPGLLVVCAAVGATGGCARVTPAAGPGGGESGETGGTSGFDASSNPNVRDASAVVERLLISTSRSVCGDKDRTADEACDDGNTTAGDGCSADCHVVEAGYSCVPAGKPCHRIARCGDGVVVLPELCDDGNHVAGDGCSVTCKIEAGYKCAGTPNVCTRTTCGDGKVEGAESCDKGDAIPFDGCSAECQSEPDCSAGACLSACGDGIVVGEDCDDGNSVDGDGCSSTCKIEPGFTCLQPPLGEKMLVPVIFRDFHPRAPLDFEPNATGLTTAALGLVKPDLDAAGKPVYTGPVAAAPSTPGYITSPVTFAQWYRDTPGVNHSTAAKLTLWNNGKGAYVNRYGANGEPWVIIVPPASYCGNVGREKLDAAGMPIPCTSRDTNTTECDRYMGLGYKLVSCAITGSNYTAVFEVPPLDGTPVFFPVDGDNFTPASERVAAKIGPPYGGWDPEKGGALHNFSFTSEVRYWFQYDASKTYTLDFTGDDDVWVFINKKLAVDMGGIHGAVQGAVTFGAGAGAAASTKLGLMNGQVYEVAVFQAERQTVSSSYRLTLSGFSAAASECMPVCGDGILGIGEECDDGKNPGGYGQCAAGCKLGEYCGDGIVQPDHEDCDDGVNIGSPCHSGCRTLIIR